MGDDETGGVAFRGVLPEEEEEVGGADPVAGFLGLMSGEGPLEDLGDTPYLGEALADLD